MLFCNTDKKRICYIDVKTYTEIKNNNNILHPKERLVDFIINGFHIGNGQFLTQHHLIERHTESTINEFPVVQSLLFNKQKKTKKLTVLSFCQVSLWVRGYFTIIILEHAAFLRTTFTLDIVNPKA